MASTIITKNKASGAPSSLSAGELAINTNDGSLYYGSTNADTGTSVSSSFTFGAITGSVISASGNVEGGSLRADDLTAGRVAFVGTDGLLVDDSDLTFTTATLTATNLASTTVDTTNLEVTTIKAKDGTAAGSIADSSGIVTLASSVLTTTDINGGTIDGCNITVGSGRTIDLRGSTAVATDFTVSSIVATAISLAGNITHTGDVNNLISFDTDTQDFQTGGSSRLDISDSGVRLGGANSRVTTILDEDNMASDSDTSLATQQSIKAYVDANAGGSVSGNTFATDLKVGRDADNLIDFTTDNQVTFRVSAGDGIIMKATGEIEATKFDGALEGNADTATALATGRTINGTSFDGTGNITLGNDSVTEAMMADNSIDSGAYVDASIDTAHIADAQVTTAKIADDAVDADKLASNAVVNASIASNAAIAHSKLAALAATKVLVGNGSNVATEVALSGDVTMDNAGAVTIGTGVVEHAMLAADAVDGDNIGDDVINSEHLVAASIDNEHLADNAVDTAEIADDAVTFAKAKGVTSNVFDNKIKLLPSDFVANDDGGNQKFGIGYVDDAGATTYGMRAANSLTELYAFVSIPQDMSATHVNIFGRTNIAVVVYEAQVNATSMTSKGTGNCNTAIDMSGAPVASTEHNFLAIKVTIATFSGGSADRIYGGHVTIAAS